MSSQNLNELNIKVFADGADLKNILNLNLNPIIKGFTTNPTLMRKSGISNYKEFALEVLKSIKNKPISFEVFADNFEEMHLQAREISSWGDNVNVKIPITNTKGESSVELVSELSKEGIICNVTAIFTLDQLSKVIKALHNETPAILSIFAGRIADTGIDPFPLMKEAVEIARSKPKSEILWASPRELLNIFQADQAGCQIITVAHDILNKLSLINKNLENFSLETVSMFYQDAKKAEYIIKTESKK
tara:strand:+ start:233 stop:973 length:741 start_codon:yes stop_codon:yes gene_type:complete